jgi:putative transposase
MDEFQSLNHTKWDCKYHVVFIPKGRKKALFGHIRQHLEEVFWRLAEQKDSRIEEGHLMPDHVHMMISIPPKYAVSQVIGYIKGKSAIHMARIYGERQRNFTGQHFWRGDISSRRLVETKRPYANIFEIRRRKTPAWISSIFSADPPLIGGPIHRGRVSAPFMPL